MMILMILYHFEQKSIQLMLNIHIFYVCMFRVRYATYLHITTMCVVCVHYRFMLRQKKFSLIFNFSMYDFFKHWPHWDTTHSFIELIQLTIFLFFRNETSEWLGCVFSMGFKEFQPLVSYNRLSWVKQNRFWLFLTKVIFGFGHIFQLLFRIQWKTNVLMFFPFFFLFEMFFFFCKNTLHSTTSLQQCKTSNVGVNGRISIEQDIA